MEVKVMAKRGFTVISVVTNPRTTWGVINVSKLAYIVTYQKPRP